MRKLWRWLRFVFRGKYRPIVVPPTRHDELVSHAQAVLKACDVLGYKLQDAIAEGLIDEDGGVDGLHKDLVFHAARVRDELVLEASRVVAPSLKELHA